MKQNRRSLISSMLAACAFPFVGRSAKADVIRDVTVRVNIAIPQDVSPDEFVHVMGTWFECCTRKHLPPGKYLVFMTTTSVTDDYGRPSCRSVWIKTYRDGNGIIDIPVTQEYIRHLRDDVLAVTKDYAIRLPSGSGAVRATLVEKSGDGASFCGRFGTVWVTWEHLCDRMPRPWASLDPLSQKMIERRECSDCSEYEVTTETK